MICTVEFRFRVSGSIGPPGVAAVLDLEGLPPVTMSTTGAASIGGFWVTATFDSDEALADTNFETLLDRLLVAGATALPGIDLAKARPPVKMRGGEIGPAYSDAGGVLGVASKDWATRLAGAGAKLSGRQRASALLVNDARFAIQPETRLVLSVSAVEALCAQPPQCEGVVEAINALKLVLRDRAMDDGDRVYLSKRLTNIADRTSPTQAFKKRLRAIGLGDELSSFEKDIYGPRGRLVHDGHGRGNLAETAERALAFASKAFLADVRFSPA